MAGPAEEQKGQTQDRPRRGTEGTDDTGLASRPGSQSTCALLQLTYALIKGIEVFTATLLIGPRATKKDSLNPLLISLLFWEETHCF